MKEVYLTGGPRRISKKGTFLLREGRRRRSAVAIIKKNRRTQNAIRRHLKKHNPSFPKKGRFSGSAQREKCASGLKGETFVSKGRRKGGGASEMSSEKGCG